MEDSIGASGDMQFEASSPQPQSQPLFKPECPTSLPSPTAKHTFPHSPTNPTMTPPPAAMSPPVTSFKMEREEGPASMLTEQHDERKRRAGVCKVCGDEASGMYFGAMVCVPCKVSGARTFDACVQELYYLSPY